MDPGRHHIHFVGIGGMGMSGIAEVLLSLGCPVSGSDLQESSTTRRLHHLGAVIQRDHDPDNLGSADVVVVSSAVPKTNPEVRAARHRGIPVIPRAEMLAELMRFKRGVAIAGTHGKTTTTSLVATLVHEGGLDPTMVVGGRLNSLDGTGSLGNGEYLVAEADESDASFLYLHPEMVVVTGIDPDHMEAYGNNLRNLEAAFRQFIHQIPFYGLAVLCLDHPRIRAMLPYLNKPWVTYGFDGQAHYQARRVVAREWQMTFECWQRGASEPLLEEVELNMLGQHNVQNALAAIAVAHHLGVSPSAIRQGLARFSGVGRRFQIRGNYQGAVWVDDYGHHPVEIRSTLHTIREIWTRRRLVVVFQPHRYTRTRDLFGEFVSAFDAADIVLLTDVYPAGEERIAEAESMDLYRGIHQYGHPGVHYVGGLQWVSEAVAEHVESGDVVVTLGAGDIGKLAQQLCPLHGEAQ